MAPAPVIDKPLHAEALPRRYSIRPVDHGRTLTCLEAPNIAVAVAADLSFSASAARKAPPGTIFLDGVAQCEPFMDLERQIYNFDHHEGCLRPFTLATCEQVLVMILKGMDLRARDWKVYANEPDLDTILAVWLILNHVRISQKASDDLRFLYALVRLEGIIDTHGLEMTDLSGFPQRLIEKTKTVIDYLRAEEIDQKRHAVWEESDRLEYTALILHKIDRIFYKSDDFVDFQDLKELARVELTPNRIAVAVEAQVGIYELEPVLDRLYGKTLGVVILRKEPGTYTLRRLDPFMPGDLKEVYRKLNYIDPGVRSRPDASKWGGSGDIGGSPRGVGTRLTPQEIAQACHEAFHKPTRINSLKRLGSAVMTLGAITVLATLGRFQLPRLARWADPAIPAWIWQPDFLFVTSLLILTALGLIIGSRGRLWRFGFALPSGKVWWVLLPVCLLAASAGGIQAPGPGLKTLPIWAGVLVTFVLWPVCVELLFRSLGHGIVAHGSEIQLCDSRWFFSYPSVAMAFLYAAFLGGMKIMPNIATGLDLPPVSAEGLFAAFAFGLAAGFARERSQSILPAISFHALAMLALLLR